MIYGYSRGLIKEILSILSILISIYISINVYPNISLFIKEYIEIAVLADSISFALMFLFLYSLINIFSNFIVSSITNTPIRILDKNFGILFGFFRALLILSLLNILLYWTLWKKNIPFQFILRIALDYSTGFQLFFNADKSTLSVLRLLLLRLNMFHGL